jgi:E3 ubiquitin-protein ligase SHPRH
MSSLQKGAKSHRFPLDNMQTIGASHARGKVNGLKRLPSTSVYSDISSNVLMQIKNIELSGSYGTKIDTLARHILWLRQHDPGSKSIVFSRYRDFLKVLGGAFSLFKIGHSSVDAKDGIERFKSDPAV